MIKYSIYIVDDEQTITDSVTMALEDDYRIKAFSDAETAIAQLPKDPPDFDIPRRRCSPVAWYLAVGSWEQ